MEQNVDNPSSYDISNSMQIIPGNKNSSIDAINENNIYGTLTQKLKLQTNKPVELIKSLNVFKFDEDIVDFFFLYMLLKLHLNYLTYQIHLIFYF